MKRERRFRPLSSELIAPAEHYLGRHVFCHRRFDLGGRG
jgi:hypothetical protein